MDQIKVAAEDLGDPTDPETGWEIHFKRTKNGPNVYNVEYTLQTLKCQKSIRPLTVEQRQAVEAAPSIDELLKRPTSDQQKDFLEKLMTGSSGEANTDETINEDFDVS